MLAGLGAGVYESVENMMKVMKIGRKRIKPEPDTADKNRKYFRSYRKIASQSFLV